MAQFLSLFADAAIFVVFPWIIWRSLGKSIPIVVIPILIGMLLSVSGWPMERLGVPSVYGNDIGWLAVLVLAFTAGLEMWQHPGSDPTVIPIAPPSLGRLVSSALVVLGVPFFVGSVLVHTYFLPLPNWHAPRGNGWVGAMSIGLCIAVSALPVLIGIVRELGPEGRPLGQLALKLAVVDDATLWVGLAILQFAAEGTAALHGWTPEQMLALASLGALALAGSWATRKFPHPPLWVIWLSLPVWLGIGSWASMQIGLHELIGAYFAGAVMPPSWVRRLPVEKVGTLALIWLAPMFFGHSGMHVDDRALTWPSVGASLLLVVIAIVTKMAAVVLYPPARGMALRHTMALGALLQCKGLMEIVAATILLSKGMISSFAYASLVLLAVISTILTGPLFAILMPKAKQRNMVPAPNGIG